MTYSQAEISIKRELWFCVRCGLWWRKQRTVFRCVQGTTPGGWFPLPRFHPLCEERPVEETVEVLKGELRHPGRVSLK